MNREHILYAIGDINERLIFDAMKEPKTRKSMWIRGLAAAACLALVLAVGVPYTVGVLSHKGGADPWAGVDQTTVDVLKVVEFSGAYYEVPDMRDTGVLDRLGLPRKITAEAVGAYVGDGLDSDGRRVGGFYRYLPYDGIETVRANGETRAQTAVYVYEEGGEYAFAVFCNYLDLDGNTHQEASEVFAVYGVDGAEDIACIEIDGKRVTDPVRIANIYDALTGSRAMGNKDFQMTYFGRKNELEQTDLSWRLAEETVTLRIETRAGLVTGELRYYPSIGVVFWALNYYKLATPIET